MIKTKCWDQNEKSTKCKDQKCIYALFILNKDLLLAGFFCTWILKKKKRFAVCTWMDYGYMLIFFIGFFVSKFSFGLSIQLFKGFSLFEFLIFQFKNTPTPLCLSRDKTKGQSAKNATLTPTKTLPKKQDHSSINFQIDLFTYK